jgi:hypothetical protein
MEEAVRWRVFHRTVQDIRERNADTDPDELQRIIDETVSEVRAERHTKGKADRAFDERRPQSYTETGNG